MGYAYVGFNSETNHNNATKKPLVIDDTLVHWVSTDAKECHFCYQSEIDELRQQVYKMAKLLNAVAAKLGVTIEKGKKVIVTQQPSDTSEEKEVVEIRLPSQSTTLKSTPTGKKEAYNPELEIKKIKKTLEPF
ncbi:hypothetical protein G9A89_012770 [Geosiphon pyriformis]|nr:hypothetical protein G9A89_012770 [Geosiphon pyriformis]